VSAFFRHRKTSSAKNGQPRLKEKMIYPQIAQINADGIRRSALHAPGRMQSAPTNNNLRESNGAKFRGGLAAIAATQTGLSAPPNAKYGENSEKSEKSEKSNPALPQAVKTQKKSDPAPPSKEYLFYSARWTPSLRSGANRTNRTNRTFRTL
jgi:hypothetical protein